MAWLIRRYRLRRTLDIGVYRGRSLLPQSIAHRDFTGGTAVGVDPWSAELAMEHDNEPLRHRIQSFARNTDFESIYRELGRLRDRLGLTKHCELVRKTSAAAAEEFAAHGLKFGLIHIDGNHDTAVVMDDVGRYLPLVEAGGFVVIDDVSWDSVRPAVQALAGQATRLLIRTTHDKRDDYAVFCKGPSLPQTLLLRYLLSRIAGRT
jgi:hypothetical protein